MFKSKQFVRNVIFCVFCILILVVSFALTYYITFYDEVYEENLKKIQINKEEFAKAQHDVCSNSNDTMYFMNSFYFKIMVAFFAGGFLSDRFFLKFGLI
jgi:hypothetical protein